MWGLVNLGSETTLRAGVTNTFEGSTKLGRSRLLAVRSLSFGSTSRDTREI